MSQKSGHIQSSFIPEGMEYREEYMLDALTLYQNHKTKIRRRRLFYGLAALAILTSSLLYLISDRDTQNKAFDASKNTVQQPIVMPDDSAGNASQSQLSVTEKNAIDPQNSSNVLDENTSPIDIISSQESQKTDHLKVETTTESSAQTSPEKKKKTDRNIGIIKNVNQPSSTDAADNFNPSANLNAINTDDVKKENTGEKKQDIPNQVKVIDSNLHDVTDSKKDVAKNERQEVPGSADNKIEENVSAISLLGFNLFDTGDQKLAPAKPMKVKYTAPARKDSYYFSAGANALTQFATNKKDLSFDPSLSLGWRHQLNQNFSFGLESGYFSIAKINRPFETTSIKYSENFTATTTTILTDKLHYIHVGPKFFFTHGLHQFELGYSLNYMLTGNNRIEVFSLSDSYTSPTASSKATGYVQGFTNFSHDLSLGYNYKIGKYTSLGFAYHFGLTDISRNQYFTTSGKDFNSRLELHIKVSIR
jgi:hypothetical protein